MSTPASCKKDARSPSAAGKSDAPMKLVMCAISVDWAAAVRRESPKGPWLVAAGPSETIHLMQVMCPSVVLVGGASSSIVAESCRKIRGARTCRDAVIVALAGDRPKEVGVLLEAGADDVLIQSFGHDVLRTRLQVARRTAATHAARRAAEDAREQFFQLSTQPLCIVAHGYFRVVNPAWTQVLGWSSEELTSTPWLHFVHPDDRQATIVAWDGLRADGPLEAFINRYRCKDGAYRWLEWRATRSIERDVTYAVVHDLTEARASKDARRELSERLATTLNSIGDGVISTDLGGVVVGMNPVAERLTGWTLEEALAKGSTLGEVLPLINGETRANVESPMERALREGKVVSMDKDTVLTRRGGSSIPIADSCAPIRSDDGTVNGAVLVFRDLTAQKSAEAVLARAQEQLVFADRMAAVGTLAAGVAHEINNPLSFVVANVDTALEEIHAMNGSSWPALLEVEKMLLDARLGADRVTKIVRGLKTFSRSSEERPHVVDLVPVLQLSIEIAANQIRQCASLITEFGPVPLVEADDARLGQVFVNLLMNAAQAFPGARAEGNEICVATSTDARGRAVVEVKDTGSGIAPALLSRVFDPFFTTKPVGTGTGLGLSITHTIVTGMGGDIAVESALGKGTTFRLALPPAGSFAPSTPTSKGSSKSPAARRGTVLVVDDEPDVCSAMRRVLRQHDVIVANDGRTALELLATGKVFDVVLSDLMMPNMSGMALFKAIAERYPELAPKVIFITGGAFTAEAHAFLDAVRNERLAKPFNSGELQKMVARLVG
jgi:PAS domain S-box-containing protein